MEFLFRASDNKRTPSPSPPPRSLSTLTYFSRLDGFSGMVPTPPRINTFPMPVNNASEALRRELEKDQIRREIIAAGIARRRELEEEVMKEMALERGWGTEQNMIRTFDNNNVYGVAQPQLPQLMPAAAEFKTSPETNKDKVIQLAKPDRDLFEAKRKAVAPPDVDGSEHFPFGLTKKPKQEEWSCALCQVSVTSERGFTEHLQGKKHRNKETALRSQKIGKSTTNTSLSSKKSEKSVKSHEAVVTTISGLDAKADAPPLQHGITNGDINQTMAEKVAVESKSQDQLVQKNQGLKDENGTMSEEEAGKRNALKKRMMKFWCEICQCGASSETVMECHKKGRKHLARMKKFSENSGSAPPTSSESLEAPCLIKDTDVVNKETCQRVEHVMSKEAIMKMINTFADDSDDSD